MTTNITEVCVKPINPKRTAVVIDTNGQEVPRVEEHEILKIVMRCGATHVLDLTGAQYGYHDQPCTLYKTYCETRSGGIVVRDGFTYFGGLRDKFADLVDAQAFEGLEMAQARVDRSLGHLIMEGINEWEKDAGVSVQQLLTILHDDIVEREQELMIKMVKNRLVQQVTLAMIVARLANDGRGYDEFM